jgi:hypothetical protein
MFELRRRLTVGIVGPSMEEMRFESRCLACADSSTVNARLRPGIPGDATLFGDGISSAITAMVDAPALEAYVKRGEAVAELKK